MAHDLITKTDTGLLGRMELAPRQGGFRMSDWWIWCGSVIRHDDGRYIMFASRWDKGLSFSPHWLTNSEIVMAVADRPTGPYQFDRVILPARGENYWDGRMTHNPAVIRFGDQYLLYYTGTTYTGPTPGTSNPLSTMGMRGSGDPAQMQRLDPRVVEAHRNQRIGVAVASRLEGPWTRLDRPVLEPRLGRWDGLITTNPAPCMNQNNRLLLIYKSVERLGGMMHLGIAGADEPTGPYRRLRDEPIFVADELGDHVEDPFFWHDRGTYHVIMKAMKGRLGGEPRGGISIETADVLHWPRPEVAVERAYSRHVRWDDGSMTTQSFLERPHLLIEEGKPTHLFAATAVGSDAIGHVTDSWNMVIPLRS